MRWLFFHNDYRSFYFLNATQFLGALNDNIFKLLVIFFLIHVEGQAGAPTILSLAGAIFVVPFLLFSSGAGVLADKWSKRTIIVATKILEVIVMLFGVLSIALQSEFGAYTTLFFMATQSAIFGPSKYGIIPELVEPKKVSKANGSITSFTYLAIILGTFLASFITQITHKNFVLTSSFCVFIAVIGLFTSFGIARTEPQRSAKKINPFFLYEIYQTLRLSWKVPHLIPAIFGSAFFLFIGAFTQLNLIPFAMQSLHLSEVGGGFLFLATAVGIAVGARIAGQLSKDRVEPGISCFSGFLVAFLFIALVLFSWSLIFSVITLACLGLAGGGFLVPFDAFIQVNSPEEKRGQIIAASNFLSFIGVLLASLFLYLISKEFGLSAASGFAVMGFMTFFASLIISGRLSSFFFPFFSQRILKRIRKLRVSSSLPGTNDLIILQSRSWWDAFLLFTCLPRLKILLPASYFHRFPWINGWIESIRLVPPNPESTAELQKLFEMAKELQEKNHFVCLFFHKQSENSQIIEAYKKVFGRFSYHLIFATIEKERLQKRFLSIHYSQTHVTLSFRKSP